MKEKKVGQCVAECVVKSDVAFTDRVHNRDPIASDRMKLGPRLGTPVPDPTSAFRVVNCAIADPRRGSSVT